MKPEDRKRLKQHIEMIVEHKEPDEIVRENFKKLQDEVADLREKNIKLRLELHTLRFKESQENRFVWWIYNVYSRNVCDLIYAIMGATTYDTEGQAKEGKYALPKECFELMKRIDEYTEHIYDGTYLDVEISTDAKKGIPENKPAYNENANSLLRSAWMIANRNGEQTNWEAFKNAVYKELVVEHNAKTSSDNNKPSISNVSVTQDVSTDIKTGQSIENANPDYYKGAEKTALVRLCGVLGVLTENNDLATAALLAATRIERLEKKIPSLNVDLAEASMHAYNGEIARMKLEAENTRLTAELEQEKDNCGKFFLALEEIYDTLGMDDHTGSCIPEIEKLQTKNDDLTAELEKCKSIEQTRAELATKLTGSRNLEFIFVNYQRQVEKLAELRERIERQAEIISVQWEKHPEDAPIEPEAD